MSGVIDLNATKLHLFKHKFQNFPGGGILPELPRMFAYYIYLHDLIMQMHIS